MRLSDRVAHFVVQRSSRLWVAALALILISAGLIAFRAHLHSDVLDMLPKEFESVQIYKLADREFSSSRELLFGLSAANDDVDLDGFAEHFTEGLRKEPWVERLMDQSPINAPASLDELRHVAAPLILNEPDEDFTKTIEALKPDAIRTRFAELKGKLAAGIGRTELDAKLDPLGIVFPSLKGLGTPKSVNSEDPLFRVVYVHCRQDDLNEPACKVVMENVESFKQRILASWPADRGAAPKIYCTGRTAYVAEMASKLKSDITTTISLSMFLVALTFYAGFRKWQPLHAIMFSLMFTCVLAVAFGAALFGSLNMITIGLCSLLVGLGVDFSMVLYSLYLHERARGLGHEESIAASLRVNGRAIWFGAMTTASAFLCLMASGSPGYGELGVLIACGITIAAGVMMTFLWLFLNFRLPLWLARVVRVLGILLALGLAGYVALTFHGWNAYMRDFLISGSAAAVVAVVLVLVLSNLTARLPDLVDKAPWRLLGPSLAVLVGLSIFAALPIGKVSFDLDPKSLEPKPSDAGDAMREIMQRLNPAGLDSIWAIIQAPDAETLSANWKKADEAWQKLSEDHAAPGTAPLFTSVATPAGLATSPARIKANAAKLTAIDFKASKASLEAALTENGFNPVEFAGTKGLVDALGEAAQGRMDAVTWRSSLPPTSAWWFVIDGFLSDQRPLGRAILSPVKPIETPAEAQALRQALAVPGVQVGFSGWGFTLIELKPWSQNKMLLLTGLMVGINSVILAYLLREWKQVTVVMLGLAFSVAGMFVTIKLLGIGLNLFNILAFPLVLGVGVDYCIYTALAVRAENPLHALKALMKPLLLSGLTTVIGFSTLAWSYNPALRGLGALCGIGVGWCVVTTFIFVLPGCVVIVFKKKKKEMPEPVGV